MKARLDKSRPSCCERTSPGAHTRLADGTNDSFVTS